MRGAHRARASQGFILAYVLFSLAVLSTVVTALSYLARSEHVHKQIESDVERIVGGARLLRMQTLLCAATYPLGAAAARVAGGTVVTSYPVHVDATSTLRAGSGDASALVCPGAPAATRALWPGASNVFYPAPPAGFGAWSYQVADDGLTVDLSIQPSSSPSGAATLRRAALQLGATASYSEGTGKLSIALARPPSS